MRLVLSGCSHKPKVSAMVSPKKGDSFYCSTCRRPRIVFGLYTTWAYAQVICRGCKYRFNNNGSLGKKRVIACAIRHANTRGHTVDVVHDGLVDTVTPERFKQLPMIDDIFLP